MAVTVVPKIVGSVGYDPTAVAITGGTIDFTSSGAGFADGTVSSPGIPFASDNDGTGTGFYRRAANAMAVAVNGVRCHEWGSTQLYILSDSGQLAIGSSSDAVIARAAANSVVFGGTSVTPAGSATSRTHINKAVTAFTNAVAKTVLTLTIPNAAHSASYMVQITGSLGAGGAIGANEASATNCYIVTLTRTAGVNATAAISAAFGAAATAVAGAATVTCTAALAAVSGAVGASNTIDLQATISRSGGTSDNHNAVVTATLLNANATGITIS